MKDRNKAALGAMVMVGLAAGAAAWYLLKTERGKETAGHLVDSLKGLRDTVRDKASDRFNQVSTHAKNVIDNLKSKTNTTV